MIVANKTEVAFFTGKSALSNGAMMDPRSASINAAVVAQSGGKLPCYATSGKRAVKWVSVNSSCVISRGVAREWLARYGVDIDVVEAT
jgi:hypothetical protein